MALSSSPSSVGTYTVIASFVGGEDYAAASTTTTFTIGKATPTVQVNDSGGIYDGAAFAATTTVAGVTGPGSSLEGVSPSVTYYNGSSASGMALSGAPSSAGTYTVIASFAGSTDYTAASTTTMFTIGKAMPTVQVNDSGGIYNGGAFAATTTVAGVAGPGSSLEGVNPSATYYNGPSASGMALSSIRRVQAHTP